jgi:hypothetical protein
MIASADASIAASRSGEIPGQSCCPSVALPRAASIDSNTKGRRELSRGVLFDMVGRVEEEFGASLLANRVRPI